MNGSIASAPLQAARGSLNEDLMDGRATLGQALATRELRHERVAIVLGYWALGVAGGQRTEVIAPRHSSAAKVALDVMRATGVDHLDRIADLSALAIDRLLAYASRYATVSGRADTLAASHAVT